MWGAVQGIPGSSVWPFFCVTRTVSGACEAGQQFLDSTVCSLGGTFDTAQSVLTTPGSRDTAEGRQGAAGHRGRSRSGSGSPKGL